MPKTLTHEIIHAAIEGFESQKKRIDAQIAELRGVLTGHTATPAAKPAAKAAPVKRKLSKAGRMAIAAAAKKRWALINAEKAKAAAAKK